MLVNMSLLLRNDDCTENGFAEKKIGGSYRSRRSEGWVGERMKSRVRPNGGSQANVAPFCFGPVSTAQSLTKPGVKCAENAPWAERPGR